MFNGRRMLGHAIVQHSTRFAVQCGFQGAIGMTTLIPEVFKSIQQRLRNIRDVYVTRSRSDGSFELEELARESYDALGRVNKNLLRMIEIERSLNAANKVTGSPQMRVCRQLLREIQQLSGIDGPPAEPSEPEQGAAPRPRPEDHAGHGR